MNQSKGRWPRTRTELIARMRHLRREIEQIFDDAAHWNEYTRKPSEAPIDPDPDGQLRRIADAFDAALAGEE